MSRIATIGFFDGVHAGHRFLFGQLEKIANERGLHPLIVTFEHHPREVLQSDYIPQLLTTQAERRTLLSAYGEVLMLPFEQVHEWTAKQFMQFLHDTYDVSVLLMGYDHRFGSDRLSHPQEYRRMGTAIGVEVLTTGEFVEGEWHVSSTEIRAALIGGNILLANELLGRSYSIRGRVVHGKGLGRTIGFPTANIVPDDPHLIIPKTGVYEVKVSGERLTVNGKQIAVKGFCNIDPQQTIEVYIPSFQGDLYGASLEVAFERFLREEKRFDSLQELQQQINADIDNILRQA